MNEQGFGLLKVWFDDLKAEFLWLGMAFKYEVAQPWFDLATEKRSIYEQ